MLCSCWESWWDSCVSGVWLGVCNIKTVSLYISWYLRNSRSLKFNIKQRNKVQCMKSWLNCECSLSRLTRLPICSCLPRLLICSFYPLRKYSKNNRRSICSLFTNKTVSPFVILQFEIVWLSTNCLPRKRSTMALISISKYNKCHADLTKTLTSELTELKNIIASTQFKTLVSILYRTNIDPDILSWIHKLTEYKLQKNLSFPPICSLSWKPNTTEMVKILPFLYGAIAGYLIWRFCKLIWDTSDPYKSLKDKEKSVGVRTRFDS